MTMDAINPHKHNDGVMYNETSEEAYAFETILQLLEWAFKIEAETIIKRQLL
jgi:hypothetical protein